MVSISPEPITYQYYVDVPGKYRVIITGPVDIKIYALRELIAKELRLYMNEFCLIHSGKDIDDNLTWRELKSDEPVRLFFWERCEPAHAQPSEEKKSSKERKSK